MRHCVVFLQIAGPYYSVQIVCHLQPFEGLSICNTIETAESYNMVAFFIKKASRSPLPVKKIVM